MDAGIVQIRLPVGWGRFCFNLLFIDFPRRMRIIQIVKEKTEFPLKKEAHI